MYTVLDGGKYKEKQVGNGNRKCQGSVVLAEVTEECPTAKPHLSEDLIKVREPGMWLPGSEGSHPGEQLG